MTEQLRRDLLKAITKRFKNDLTVSENMISFIKDYICKNAHEYLDVKVDAKIMSYDDIVGAVFDNRVNINVCPKSTSDFIEFIYKEHISSEDMFNRQKYSNVRVRECSTPTLGPRPR